MGARITFERITCPTEDDRDDEVYVRTIVNDRTVQLPGCVAYPGHTCSLDSFIDYVNIRKEKVGDFGQVCGLEGHAEKITFLHQPWREGHSIDVDTSKKGARSMHGS